MKQVVPGKAQPLLSWPVDSPGPGSCPKRHRSVPWSHRTCWVKVSANCWWVSITQFSAARATTPVPCPVSPSITEMAKAKRMKMALWVSGSH